MMSNAARRSGLTRENGEAIAFVLTALFCSAINRDELREWCYQVIGQLEIGEAPGYLFELVEYQESLAGIDRVLGFVPGWKHSDDEEAAIYGIAARRGAERFDWPVDEAAALAALARNPAIEARFRRTFPFVEF